MSLKKISFITALIGILILFLLSSILPAKQLTIEDIDNKLINKKVEVSGEIFNIKSYENSNFQIISIRDNTGKIDITLNKIINLSNDQKIIVIGKINQFNGFLQIQADKISTPS